jgi:hypothetical protein
MCISSISSSSSSSGNAVVLAASRYAAAHDDTTMSKESTVHCPAPQPQVFFNPSDSKPLSSED